MEEIEEAEERERRRITAIRPPIGQLCRAAQAMMGPRDPILTHPDWLNVEAYTRPLPGICGYLPVSDPRMQRLPELPTLAGRIIWLMNLSREERRIEFSTSPGNPHTQCALAIQSSRSELERACGECEPWLAEVVGPLRA